MKLSKEDLLKTFVNVICCFVPDKRTRKRLRYELVDVKKDRSKLIDKGFKLEDEIITTPQGVKIDISNTKDHPLYLVKAVFVKSEYNLNIKRDSILIDIGMNRGMVSLLFATDENIKNIYAYEPFKPTFEAAKKNLYLNPQLSKKISCYDYGLGNSDKKLEIPYMEDDTGSMSTTHDVSNSRKNIKKETVVVRDAVDVFTSILEENKDKYVIVKCDCEGAEFEIFERLKEGGLISRIDVVMMEYHFEEPDRLIDILTEEAFAVQTKVGSQRSQTGYLYAVRMPEK